MLSQASNLKTSQVVAVVSGKGGVGKTLIAANLAAVFAEIGRRTLLLDTDVGFTNSDIILGVYPKYSIKDFVNHKCTVEDLITRTEHGLDLISLGGDVSDLLMANDFIIRDFTTHFLKLLENYDVVVMDMPPGFNESYMPFLALVDDFLVVTTTEPTSVVNTYTMVKLLSLKGISGESIHLVANMVQDAKEATKLLERFAEVSERFLNNRVSSMTLIKEHPGVERSVRERVLFVKQYRSIQPSFSIRRIVSILIKEPVVPKDREGLIEKFVRFFRGDRT